MKYIYLRSSDIAKLTGHNNYEPKERVINQILSRNGIKDIYIPKSNIENGLLKLTKSQLIILREELNLPDNCSISNIEKSIKSSILYPSQIALSEEESRQILKSKTLKKPTLIYLLNYMNHDLRMRRGNIKENKNLDTIEKKKNIKIEQRNSKMYTKELYRGDNYCLIIRGKVDGITNENNIIETKNRTRCLFNELRDYEQVQLECYMFLTGLNDAMLLEHYNEESNCIKYSHNEEFWTMCKENIIKFIDTHIATHIINQ